MNGLGVMLKVAVFAAWLGTPAIAFAQETEPRAVEPRAPTAAPRVAPKADTVGKPAAAPTVAAPTPAPVVQEEPAAAISKSGALVLARPDLRCLLRVRQPPAIGVIAVSPSQTAYVQFDPERTRFDFETHVQNIGQGISGNGVGWLKIRVNGGVVISQPVPFDGIKTGMGGWEDGGPFEVDLVDQPFAMGYDIVAELEVAVLAGNDELNKANNSCAVGIKVVRPIEAPGPIL